MSLDLQNRVAALGRALSTWAAVIALLGASGCGGDSVLEEYSGTPSVSGTVTMDRSPLVVVTVSFENADGGLFQAVTDAAGKYVFESGAATPPAGKYRVRITDPAAVEGARGASEESATARFNPALPARYNSDTELVVDVLAGQNSIDFMLTTALPEDGIEE